MKCMSERKKVLVGMSGGVDSSAAALLLMKQGYDVSGCTMRLYDNNALGDGFAESGCCSLSDVDDAKSVCRRIGIEHFTFNFTDDFAKYVMKPFADSYIRGETPNPCIECNRHMKFDVMLRRAELLGFDYIATGHYALTERDGKTGRFILKRPDDRRKDQTYVLYSLTQHQLEHTLFPLYGMEKAAVRELAEQNGLVTSHKPDSQDICFVPDGKYADFIERYTGYKSVRGDFIDEEGNVLGQHSGIINYTVGQRRGLGIALGKPVFVTAKDPVNNTVTLSENVLLKDTLFLRDVNLIALAEITSPTAVTAKARYNAKDTDAVVYPADGNGIYKIVFHKPVSSPALGQACVFYIDDAVAGGGIICG